jgi:hypothetical protein
MWLPDYIALRRLLDERLDKIAQAAEDRRLMDRYARSRWRIASRQLQSLLRRHGGLALEKWERIKSRQLISIGDMSNEAVGKG